MALEIRCSDLGYANCIWNAVANTEDKLVDYVAVHMRDEHGIINFTQEMITEVKKKLGPTSASLGEEEPTMKEYQCPDCDWRYIAQTVNLIADAAAVHARDEHGVTEFTEEMITEVKNSLKPWAGS